MVRKGFEMFSAWVLLLCCPLMGQSSAEDKAEMLTRNKRRVVEALTLNDELREIVVDLHNANRRNVIPSASNMIKMAWSEELESLAGNFSRRCMFEHNLNRSRATRFSSVGENLSLSSGTARTVALMFREAISAWFAEHTVYDYGSQSCSAVCGHYTQLVWATSALVICGITTCANITFSVSRLLVCNYAPAGNFVGSRPYQRGRNCSACPMLYPHCDDQLCTDEPSVKPTTSVQTTSSSASSKFRKTGEFFINITGSIFCLLSCCFPFLSS